MSIQYYVSWTVLILAFIFLLLEIRWLPYYYQVWKFDKQFRKNLVELGIDPNLSDEEIYKKLKEYVDTH